MPRTAHAADDLIDSIERVRAPACVGIDPVLDRLPAAVRSIGRGPAHGAAAVERFTCGVLDAVAGEVPAVKFQSACYERFGSEGVAALERSIAAARERGLEVILDAKRGDIGISAEHYAAAVFGEGAGCGGDGDGDDARVRTAAPCRAAWVTASAYLGAEGIRPFLARGGVFALVRTSNPDGDALQSALLADGRTVAEAVADLVASLGRESVGCRGYSALGAVVGATKWTDAARLRERMPQQIFLVPGFGAQGGSVRDVLPCFDARGTGALVTASRSVIYAFDEGASPWEASVRDAARRFADEIGRGVGLR